MLCETLPRLEADKYPGGLWYYEPHTYQPYRYVLLSPLCNDSAPKGAFSLREHRSCLRYSMGVS